METQRAEPLGKDVFLSLLSTQLRYQDPLEPMDGTAFVTQLAQFSQLEQTTNMSERIGDLVAGNDSLNNYGVTALIGQEVKVLGGSVRRGEVGFSELSYRLKEEAQEVIVQISDSTGNVVRTVRSGTQSEGVQSISWDGRDQEGNALPAGEYQFLISAKDALGGPIKSERFSSGIVTGVVYEEGVPYLRVNGQKVPASEVVAVNG